MNGTDPTVEVWIMVSVDVSITETLLPGSLATKANASLGVTQTPQGVEDVTDPTMVNRAVSMISVTLAVVLVTYAPSAAISRPRSRRHRRGRQRSSLRSPPAGRSRWQPRFLGSG